MCVQKKMKEIPPATCSVLEDCVFCGILTSIPGLLHNPSCEFVQRCKGLTVDLCGHLCLPVHGRSATCFFYRILTIVLERTAVIMSLTRNQ